MEFISEDTLHYYIPSGFDVKDKWFCFDLDDTLAFAQQHLFPCLPQDIHILPKRKNILRRLSKEYTLIIFTNQKAKSKDQVATKIARVSTFLRKIKLPIATFIATGDDEFRKPGTCMYGKCCQLLGCPTEAYFCGDALGRPGDFSDSDAKFAENTGMILKTPEEVFRPHPPPKFGPKTMVVLVGMPGCGKTTYYNKHLSYLKWINQDTLKTKVKVFKALNDYMFAGDSVCVDCTNVSQELRYSYYNLAEVRGFTPVVIHFTNNGHGRNKLRDAKVADVVYHMLYKQFNPPKYDVLDGKPVKVHRV